MRRTRRLARLVVPACSLLLWATGARAQRDPAAAEALFRDGMAALDRGELEVACAKLRESNDVDPAPGTLFNLAECEKRRGRTGTAWALFAEVRDRLPPADERRTMVAARIAELEPRLTRLTVRLAAQAPTGARVSRDGIALGPGSLGSSVVVDPGQHELTVEADGHQRRSVRVLLADGEQRAVTVEPGGLLPDPPRDGAANEGGAGLHPVGLTLLGLGVVGVGVGIGLGLAADSRYHTVDGLCQDNVCNQEGYDTRKDALALSYGGTAALLGGVALAVVGGILEIVELTESPPERERSVSFALAPWLGPSGLGWTQGISGRARF